jgi:hypothetical protein
VRLTESDLVRLVKRVLSEQMSKLTPENSMVGKTYKLDNKRCTVEKAFKLPNEQGFVVLAKEKDNGCTKPNNKVDGEGGYVYMRQPGVGEGPDGYLVMMSQFEWKGDGWVYEPRYHLGTIQLS